MPPRRARGAAAGQPVENPQMEDMFARLLQLNENYDPVARARHAGAVTFPGYPDPETCEAWIVQVERIFERLYFAPEQWTPTAVGLLEADGYYWWCSTGRIPLDTPWPVFRDLFMRRYFSPAAQQRKYEEFTSLKQGEMIVMDYRDKFTWLSRFAPTMVATDEERCRRFEWGLNLNIRAALTTMARDNFDDFVSAAI